MLYMYSNKKKNKNIFLEMHLKYRQLNKLLVKPFGRV